LLVVLLVEQVFELGIFLGELVVELVLLVEQVFEQGIFLGELGVELEVFLGALVVVLVICLVV